MAEKTEAPTPRRRQEARERGEIARSPEVNSAVALIVAFVLLRGAGASMSGELSRVLQSLLELDSQALANPQEVRTLLAGVALQVGMGMAPFVACLLGAGVAASAAQTGFMFAGQPLVPRWNRVSPFTGLKRLFSARGLVELLKASAKMAIVLYVAYSVLRGRVQNLVVLPNADLRSGTYLLWMTATDVGIRVGLVMLVIALADYVYQRRQHEKGLRMTRQELIEEMKRYENPFIRSRIRQQQRQLAMRRMMADVPKADVVITNPTEIAVALRYDRRSMQAPTVVAKGQRLMAERIRSLAEEHGVPIVERKPLARALYAAVEVGAQIPGDLYQAVAEVLAFVYSLRERRAEASHLHVRGERP